MSKIRYGFTLIEVLVVIAIVAILAGILLPVFSRAREKGRQAKCLSNQRQITMRIAMWAEEHDGMLPEEENFWHGLKLDPPVMMCPSAGDEPVGYLYNERVAGARTGEFPYPVRTLLTADGRSVDQIGRTETSANDFVYRHTNALIAGYLDGHVALVDPTKADFFYLGDEITTVEELYQKFGIRVVTCGWQFPATWEADYAPQEQIDVFLPALVAEMSVYPTHALSYHPKKQAPPAPCVTDIVICTNMKHHVPQDNPRRVYFAIRDDVIYVNLPTDGSLPTPASAKPIHACLFKRMQDCGTLAPINDTLWSSLNPPGFVYVGDVTKLDDTPDDAIVGFLASEARLSILYDQIISWEKLIDDPDYVAMRAEDDSIVAKKVDMLKSAIAKGTPDIDVEFWKYLTKKRSRPEQPKSTYTPLGL